MSTAGDETKRAGMSQVERNADEAWKAAVLEAIRSVAHKMQYFTMEHVRFECSQMGVPEPHHVNAWGPMLKVAAKEGYCESTNTYSKGTTAASHGHAMLVWRSLLV